MSKESFLYSETQPVFDLIEETSRRSAVSRGQAFEDFLHMSLCALSGGQMEEQYFATVKKHADGTKGKRGCDSIARAFGMLVDAMEKPARTGDGCNGCREVTDIDGVGDVHLKPSRHRDRPCCPAARRQKSDQSFLSCGA